MKSNNVETRPRLPRSAFMLAAILLPGLAHAQTTQLDDVIGRLTRLERENDRLRTELAEVRQQLESMRVEAIPQYAPKPQAGVPAAEPQTAAPAIKGTTEERLEIAERRIEEQAQTKVEASQRLPVRLSGILLANIYRNGPNSGTADVPPVAAPAVQAGAGHANLDLIAENLGGVVQALQALVDLSFMSIEVGQGRPQGDVFLRGLETVLQ